MASAGCQHSPRALIARSLHDPARCGKVTERSEAAHTDNDLFAIGATIAAPESGSPLQNRLRRLVSIGDHQAGYAAGNNMRDRPGVFRPDRRQAT